MLGGALQAVWAAAQRKPYLTFTIGFGTAAFAFETYIAQRQRACYGADRVLPAPLKGLMPVECFNKAREYGRDKSSFSAIKEVISHGLTTGLLLSPFYPVCWTAAMQFTAWLGFDPSREILVSVVFMTGLSFFSAVTALPFDVYSTFVIEERHGFNKQTGWFFAKDQLKRLVVNSAVMGVLFGGLLNVIRWGGEHFFLYAWAFVFGFSVLLTALYADLIAPLFDEFVPLPDGELRESIEALARQLSFPLQKLFVVKNSKRSSHSNAYFYGFFSNKRIVLFDTLLAEPLADEADAGAEEDKPDRVGCTTEEIVAILAHELGHWHHNHVLKLFSWSQVQTLAIFYLFGKLVTNQDLFADFGFHDSRPMVVGLLIVMEHILAPLNMVLGYTSTQITRRFEYQADGFAIEQNRSEALQKALLKLNKQNLGYPIWDPVYSALNHSHPTLLQRLEFLSSKKAA